MPKISFTLGPPNEEELDARGLKVRVRDELGVSFDPREFADRNCSTCWGKGVVPWVAGGAPDAVRKHLPFVRRREEPPHSSRPSDDTPLLACGCVRPRRERVRRIVAAAKGLPQSLG